MEFRTILVATDFSPYAARALDSAVTLAKTTGADLDLIYAVHVPIPPAMPDTAIIPDDLVGQMREHGRTRIEQEAGRAREAGVACKVRVVDGPPSKVLLKRAEEIDASLIVVGKRGQSALEHVVLGSVAERVMRAAKCPVLAVPAEGRALALKTILVPTDFSETANAALQLARELGASAEGAQLILTYAQHVPIDVMQFLVQRGDQVVVEEGVPIIERISEHAMTQLERLLEGVRRSGVRSELVMGRGTPEQVIIDTAREREADLIVMGTHGRRGVSHMVLGSVAERVVRAADCAVLTVRHVAG